MSQAIKCVSADAISKREFDALVGHTIARSLANGDDSATIQARVAKLLEQFAAQDNAAA